MEKNYETFVNNLRERLLKATGYQEEMICYKTAEEYPPTDGDRLLLKNRQREGVYEVCALYVADLYEWHQNGSHDGADCAGDYTSAGYYCQIRMF